jgi:hypothetical protein
MRVFIFPAFTASSRQRSSSSNSAFFSSGTSFFNGWRATPGINPATVLFISTTATNVSP